MELGAGRRGADMGPAAIRHADLVNRLEAMGKIVEDRGNIHVPVGMNTANKSMRYRKKLILSASLSLVLAILTAVKLCFFVNMASSYTRWKKLLK